MATENQHKENSFTPVTAALELADYVFQITGNLKRFPDCSVKEQREGDKVTQLLVFRDDSLVNTVREEARQIYHLVFTANEINLNRQPWRKNERLTRQAEAIALCGDLLADILLCRKHFHLTSKRIKYWGGLVRSTRAAIERWHDSDKARYKDI